MNWQDCYNPLVKPSWPPARATIGLISHILHPVILVTYGMNAMKLPDAELPVAKLPENMLITLARRQQHPSKQHQQ